MATRVTHSPFGMEVREEQQRIVLDVLAAASGEPVPYARIRDAGVEYPASVIAELELAGFPVRRCPTPATAHPRDPAVCLREPAQAGALGATPAGLPLDSPARRSHPRGVALAVVAAIACVVAALAVIGSFAPRGRGAAAIKHAAARAAAHATPVARSAPRSRPKSAAVVLRKSHPTRRIAAPAPASAAALQLSGHQLLASGRYAQATFVLREAMRATGMDGAGCAEPVGESCLVYAYALYDLGRALLLDGRPAEAVVVLEERLRIANQRPVVAAELALARASAAGRSALAQNRG